MDAAAPNSNAVPLAAARFLGEHLFLGLALFIAIPPIPSGEERYSFDIPQAALMILLVLASRACARGHAETWLGAAMKAGTLVVFGFLNYGARS